MTHVPGGRRPADDAATAPVLARALLAGVDADVAEFVRRTSALGSLSAARCDALLHREGSAALLDELTRDGLVTPEAEDAGGRRFRYQLALQEALERELEQQLGPAGIRDWYRRAGEVLEADGAWWAALRAFGRADDRAGVERLLAARPAGPALPTPGPRPLPGTGAAVDVRLLGGFEIHSAGAAVDLGRVRPRVRTVLQYLALHADAYVHRDVLAAVLWPESDLDTGRRGVQVAVSSLRSLLQPGQPRQSTLLPRRGDAYALVLDGHGSSDVTELDAQLARGRRARAAQDAAAAARAWSEVARLYRGDLLLEQGNAEWVVGERDRLRLAVADALESLGRHLVVSGTAAEGIEALRRALDLDPFRDTTWRGLAEAHEAAGDRAAAAAVRGRHRRVLADLGVLDGIDLRDVGRRTPA